MSPKYRWLSDEDLAELASRFETKADFFEADTSAYVTAHRRGILDTICAHMYRRHKWPRHKLEEAAREYQTRSEFAKGNKAAYTAAHRKGILDEICAHMVRKKKVMK